MALQQQNQEPLSEGNRKFPYQRPSPECRTFNLPAMESLIERMKGVIKDPDLFRLFENSYPNTLDTMIKWRGYAKERESDDQVPIENGSTSEELTYVITGDVRSISLRI
jgi:meiotically up-regulated gene 157 (Mug157) protein